MIGPTFYVIKNSWYSSWYNNSFSEYGYFSLFSLPLSTRFSLPFLLSDYTFIPFLRIGEKERQRLPARFQTKRKRRKTLNKAGCGGHLIEQRSHFMMHSTELSRKNMIRKYTAGVIKRLFKVTKKANSIISNLKT